MHERLESSAFTLRVPDQCIAATRALCCVHDLSGVGPHQNAPQPVPPRFCEQRSTSRASAAGADSGSGREGTGAAGGSGCAGADEGRLAATSLRLVDTSAVSANAIRRQTTQERHVECAVRLPAHWAYIVRVDAFEVFDCHFLELDAFVEIWAGAPQFLSSPPLLCFVIFEAMLFGTRSSCVV